MTVSYSKDQRELAKKTGQRLFTLAFTGKGGKGGVTVQGLCSGLEAGKVSDLIMISMPWGEEAQQTQQSKSSGTKP